MSTEECGSAPGGFSERYSLPSRLSKDLLDFLWMFMFLVGNMYYICLGMGLISITVSLKHSVVELLQAAILPAYIVASAFLWSITGSYFEESLSGMNDAIYNSAWMDLSPPARKILLLLMLKGHSFQTLNALPFYTVNRIFLANVSEEVNVSIV